MKVFFDKNIGALVAVAIVLGSNVSCQVSQTSSVSVEIDYQGVKRTSCRTSYRVISAGPEVGSKPIPSVLVPIVSFVAGNLVPVVRNCACVGLISDACGVAYENSWQEWPAKSVIGAEFWLSTGGVKRARVVFVVSEVPKQVGGSDTGLGLFYSFNPDGYDVKGCVCSHVWYYDKLSFGGGISALKNDMINGGLGIRIIEELIACRFRGVGYMHNEGCLWRRLDVVSYVDRCIFYTFESN